MNIMYKRIKELASLNQVSIREIERCTGLPNGAVYYWKHGQASQKAIVAIADYFNVSADYLLGRIDKNERLTIGSNSTIG